MALDMFQSSVPCSSWFPHSLWGLELALQGRACSSALQQVPPAGSEQHMERGDLRGGWKHTPKHLSWAALSHQCQQASCEPSVWTSSLVREISAEESYYFYRCLFSPKPDIYMIWGVLEMQKCTISAPQIQQRKKISGRSPKKWRWANSHLHLPEDLLELLQRCIQCLAVCSHLRAAADR